MTRSQPSSFCFILFNVEQQAWHVPTPFEMSQSGSNERYIRDKVMVWKLENHKIANV
jgi:hypothetical protein